MNLNKSSIIDIIKKRGQISAHELGRLLGISQSMLHRHLRELIKGNNIQKAGTPPKVYYSILQKKYETKSTVNIDQKEIDIINENFSLLEPTGIEVLGFSGFQKWCEDRNYKITEKAKEYIQLLKEYENLKKDDFVNASSKIKNSFSVDDTFLNELYYLYPYSLPVFGKTKIGQWLFYAKQTQDKKLMQKVIKMVVPKIQNFITLHKIEAIGFVPPTVPRNIQLMKELERNMQNNLPIIKIEKIKTPITIQQKSLKDIKDRIINADSTMYVSTRNQKYKKILLIDDFTGSGATLNVLAKKIKRQNDVQNIVGLTIAGSMNGFEVVKEI